MDTIEDKKCNTMDSDLNNNPIGVTPTSEDNQTNGSTIERNDQYCWHCHKKNVNYRCKTCPRSYHTNCPLMRGQSIQQDSCPQCMAIMKAEELTHTSGDVHKISPLLEYTIVNVKDADINRLFLRPVPIEVFPKYLEYIVNPMDLSLVEEKVKNKTYSSTTSFLADIKWIYHNCVVFNSRINKFIISEAKHILSVAKQECDQIDICPDCCLNFYTSPVMKSYFAIPCDRPHTIVWAKLRGHPYWPAKVIRYNKTTDEVDIHFFGEHNRCWLKPENCYLMSRNYPENDRPSNLDQEHFDEAIRDLNSHLNQLVKKFEKPFLFYDKKTAFTVDKLYLNYDQMSTPSKEDIEVSPIVSIEFKTDLNKDIIINASHKKQRRKQVIDCGMALKPYEGDTRLDTSPHFVNNLKTIKRKKGSVNGSTHPKRKYFINEKLSASSQLDQSYNDSEYDSEMMSRSFSPNTSFDLKWNSRNRFNGNGKTSEANGLNDSLNCGSISSQTLTASETCNENVLLIDSNNNMSRMRTSSYSPSPTDPEPNIKFPQNMKTESIEELLKRIKSLEFKNRKLEEELSEANNKSTAVEEENDGLKRCNEELKITINDNKLRMWCAHCLEEALLHCCWNTYYCTIECQHHHWPIHSKKCRQREETHQQRVGALESEETPTLDILKKEESDDEFEHKFHVFM